MSCNKCYTYIYDFLLSPPHPSAPCFHTFKRKRLLQCINQIVPELQRYIERADPGLTSFLDQQEKFHNWYEIIISKEHNMFKVWYKSGREMDYALCILREHCVLKNTKEERFYHQWFGEKFIQLLASVPEVHNEHSPKPKCIVRVPDIIASPFTLTIRIPPNEYDDLYC